MSLVRKALWIIERNGGDGVTLPTLAEACGVSTFHLSHAFARTTGQSVMAFARGRRLSEAARRLADGEADILGLALDSGYDSHEAFSRAFKVRFGQTPEAVRQAATLAGLDLVQSHVLDDAMEIEPMTPTIKTGPAFRAIGTKARYDLGKTGDIPRQWQAFMARVHEIEGRSGAIPLGICLQTDSDACVDYLTAVEVAAGSKPPAGMTAVDIAPQKYAVFEHRDHVSTLGKTYAAAFDHGIADAGLEIASGTSLERHCPTFDPRTGNGGIDIWIPVK